MLSFTVDFSLYCNRYTAIADNFNYVIYHYEDSNRISAWILDKNNPNGDVNREFKSLHLASAWLSNHHRYGTI